MKLSCAVVRDLLPLYCEGECSPETVQAVAEHIASCQECRVCWERMSRPLETPPPEEPEEASLMRAYAAKVRKGRIRRSVLTVLGVLLLSLLGGLVFCTLQVMERQKNPLVYETEEGVWNLTASDLAVTEGELDGYTLYTNYAQILVAVEEASREETVYLYDAEAGEVIMESALNGSGTVLFTGLTSARLYAVVIDGGDPEAAVTVSEGRETGFWPCLMIFLRELML